MDELIYNGHTYRSDEDTLISTNAYLGDSLAAESLSVDTLTSQVRDYQLQTRLLAVDGMLAAADGTLLAGEENDQGLKEYKYGDLVLYKHDGVLLGRFYLEQIDRVGRYGYKISALSAVGLLLTDNYYGGIYNGITTETLIKDIVAGIFSYTIDAEFGASTTYGLLKKSSRRDALRDVLFSQGGQIRKDESGNVVIGPQTEGEPYQITPDEFYQGGSVAGLTPATEIRLTEHTYIALPTDERITLFDGEAAAEEMETPLGAAVMGVLVEFSEPIHDLEASNVTVLESGANYAVLSQSPAATLTGQRYTHVERIITRKNKTSGPPNVVQSSECTLVNLLNAENVADRLFAYYGSAKSVETDLVMTTQKPGDAVDFTDPYGDETSGYIASLDITMSAILKARATLISGFIPTSSGNYYTHVDVIQTDQIYYIKPEAKGKARIVLIGGGDGGGRGENGATSGLTGADFGTPGEGGAPGTPGNGGKIYIVTVKVTVGQSFSVTLGDGGTGETDTEAATPGKATTFGPYTSELGLPSEVGYVDLINGTTYGQRGDEGIAGGRGSSKTAPGPSITYQGVTYHPGNQGPDVNGNDGGYGGGAAAGENGNDGMSAMGDLGGGGGDGADAAAPGDATNPGQGGPAGNGGGGGGARGAPQTDTIWGEAPVGGSGAGSKGGNGAKGIALVYY